ILIELSKLDHLKIKSSNLLAKSGSTAARSRNQIFEVVITWIIFHKYIILFLIEAGSQSGICLQTQSRIMRSCQLFQISQKLFTDPMQPIFWMDIKTAHTTNPLFNAIIAPLLV